jgi:hypothetical protein
MLYIRFPPVTLIPTLPFIICYLPTLYSSHIQMTAALTFKNRASYI